MQTIASKDGTKIAYDRIGQGPAVILIGGALQYRSFDPRTAKIAELLSQDFTVYNYDRRGRGDSTDTQPYAKEREIEDLAALVDEAGGQAMAFAMSSGSALALDAVANGIELTHLAIYEPPFVVDDTRPALPVGYVERLTTLTSEGKKTEAVAYFLENAALVPKEYVSGMQQDPSWSGMEAVAQTLAYDGVFMADVSMGKPLPADRWSGITSQLCVLDGGESDQWVHNAANALLKLIPQATRKTLAGQSHAVAPEVLVPELKDFYVQSR